MRKLKLGYITPPDLTSSYTEYRRYRLIVGNSKVYTFKSVTRAKEKLMEINKKLNSLLHELNRHYLELQGIYRRYYFYFEDKPKKVKHIDLAKTIAYGFRNSEENFDKLWSHTNSNNGSYYGFSMLKLICEYLLDSCLGLYEMAHLRMDSYTKFQLKEKQKRLERIQSSFLEL